jgi:hypothetical protein
VDRRGIGNADEVKAKLKGLLLYLFSQTHFLHRKRGCNLYYTIF